MSFVANQIKLHFLFNNPTYASNSLHTKPRLLLVSICSPEWPCTLRVLVEQPYEISSGCKLGIALMVLTAKNKADYLTRVPKQRLGH